MFCSSESRAQISLLGQTVDTVVATSHFYPNKHRLDEFILKVDRAAERLKNEIADRKAPEICLGAEVLLCEGLDRLEGVEQLCIRGTSCMLVEMPNVGAWNGRIFDTVEALLDKDIVVVLAHIDRYLKEYEDGIDRLLEMGAKAQVNATSIASYFSRKRLMPYLHSGAVCAIGSDLHGVDKAACRDFASVERKIGAELYIQIMKKSERLLDGAERF